MAPDFKGRNKMTKPTVTGKGGNAKVIGRDSTAVGGDAGGSVYERGGHGGGAAVVGNYSKAFGGPGGRGGLGPGQDGGHANAIGDNMLVAGGEGGEAGQRDGRGGRGGRSGWEVFNARGDRPAEGLYKHLGIDLSKYGRGGDGANSTQCVARLAMVSTQVKN